MTRDIASIFEKRRILRGQFRELNAQGQRGPRGGGGESLVWITCPCGRRIALRAAYKCLYCSLWFCGQCAKEHFGREVSTWDVGYSKPELAAALANRMGWEALAGPATVVWLSLVARICNGPLTKAQLVDLLAVLDESAVDNRQSEIA